MREKKKKEGKKKKEEFRALVRADIARSISPSPANQLAPATRCSVGPAPKVPASQLARHEPET